jgi:hypothetical protein
MFPIEDFIPAVMTATILLATLFAGWKGIAPERQEYADRFRYFFFRCLIAALITGIILWFGLKPDAPAVAPK